MKAWSTFLQTSRMKRISAVAALVLFAMVAGCAASPMQQGAARYSSSDEAMAPVEMEAAATASPGSVPADMVRKVIANAFTELVVDDTQKTVDAINELIDEAGGYVSQANLYRDTHGGRNLLRGTLTLRVPASELESLMAQLETMAIEVRSKSIDREDVTDQYSDTEAQLRNLEATENELRELLEEVRSRPNSTSEDILAVHRDLTAIRGEIEQLQGRKNMLDNLIAMSTLNVTLIPDEANRPVVEERWKPGSVMKDATRALVFSLQFLGSAAIWIVVYLLPILLLMLIPLVIVIWIIRTVVVRRRRRKQEKAEDAADADNAAE